MNKLITFISLFFISLSASAGIHIAHGQEKLIESDFDSKAEAYQAGFDLISQYNDLPQHQLRHRLNIFGGSFPRDVKIDDSQVKVEEYAETFGEIKYRTIVNIAYQYRASDSGNN